jgi:hypothetical protein
LLPLISDEFKLMGMDGDFLKSKNLLNDDIHLTKEGHRILSELMMEEIKSSSPDGF